MKTAMVTIQVDDIQKGDLDKIEEAIEEALKEFKRVRISYSVNKMFGPPIPENE